MFSCFEKFRIQQLFQFLDLKLMLNVNGFEIEYFVSVVISWQVLICFVIFFLISA